MGRLFFIATVFWSLTLNSIAQGNQEGSWLPEGQNTSSCQGVSEMNCFLRPAGITIRPLVCSYEGEVLTSLTSFQGNTASVLSSSWTCKGETEKKSDKADESDFQVTFSVTEGMLASGGVAVAFDFWNWKRENYVLMPAYVYNGNRFHVETNGYMSPYPESYYYNENAPLLFSNSPRLSEQKGKSSKIEGLMGNLATPAVCFYMPEQKRACIILTEQKNRLGNLGIFLEENANQDMASLVISAPGVREQAAGFGDFRKSGDRACLWKAGDTLTMKFKVYSFKADGIPDLLAQFMEVRKKLTGKNTSRNICPFSEITALTSDYKNKVRWKEDGDNSFYRMENSDGYQVGWVGGLMGTFPLLALNDSLSRERVLKTYDYVFSRMIGESGYFYGSYRNGKIVSDRDNIPEAALVRKNADILFFMIKHFLLLEQQGYARQVKQEWKDAAENLAKAFVKTWNKNKDLGNYVNAKTGDIIIYHTTSGAIAPAGLVLASQYFGNREFLKAAKEIAAYFYNDYVVKLGLTCAHSGDIMQDADADSAYGLVESLMALYAATTDKKWLSMAETTANLAATWTLSYDYEYPEKSTLGRLKAKTAGAVWASVQNKHAAPGICTSSGDYLFKLYRATGKECYAELLRDIVHAHGEVMEIPGRITTNAGAGTSMERIQTTDADGKGAVGMILNTSNGWTEDCGLLMALEIPGIYVQTDKDRIYVFDHVEAKVINRENGKVVLQITNPTHFDALVSVFSESSSDSKKPIGYLNFVNWKKVPVKAGETVEVSMGKK